jgi:hypothetical protein
LVGRAGQVHGLGQELRRPGQVAQVAGDPVGGAARGVLGVRAAGDARGLAVEGLERRQGGPEHRHEDRHGDEQAGEGDLAALAHGATARTLADSASRASTDAT